MQRLAGIMSSKRFTAEEILAQLWASDDFIEPESDVDTDVIVEELVFDSIHNEKVCESQCLHDDDHGMAPEINISKIRPLPSSSESSSCSDFDDEILLEDVGVIVERKGGEVEEEQHEIIYMKNRTRICQ